MSYAGYFTIPALGPRFAQADLYTKSLTDDPDRAGRSTTRSTSLEKTKLDVFPSGHTMISMAVLIVMWKRARDVFWWLLPDRVGTDHLDRLLPFPLRDRLIAGTTLAFIVVPLGDRLYDWADAPRARPWPGGGSGRP